MVCWQGATGSLGFCTAFRRARASRVLLQSRLRLASPAGRFSGLGSPSRPWRLVRSIPACNASLGNVASAHEIQARALPADFASTPASQIRRFHRVHDEPLPASYVPDAASEGGTLRFAAFRKAETLLRSSERAFPFCDWLPCTRITRSSPSRFSVRDSMRVPLLRFVTVFSKFAVSHWYSRIPKKVENLSLSMK